MATLTIRNIDQEVIDAFKILSKELGRSMEGQARWMIEDAVADRLEAPAQV